MGLVRTARHAGYAISQKKRKRNRRMFWRAEDYCAVAQSAASRNAESRLDLHVCLRGLQPGAHAEPDAQHSSDIVSPGRSVSERRSNASFGAR